MESARGFLIIFNPRAGRGRSYEILRTVTSALDDRIAPVIETTLDGAFAARLRERHREITARTGLPPVIVAVGGDGTLSLTLNAMRDPDESPVAIVPAGSGNDFAAALGIADARAALAAIEVGETRRVDLATVNGRRFVNCVGMGLDAEVGALSARLRARGFPAGPSYYAGALVGLFMVRPVGVALRAEGRSIRSDDAVMVTVGNGPMYGGGFRGAPGATLDDGLLDVFTFSNVDGFFRRFALMQRIKAGTHPTDPNVTAFQTASLAVTFDRDVAMHVDGEIATVRSAAIELSPRAWAVVAPP